jgi:hypothetical protein
VLLFVVGQARSARMPDDEPGTAIGHEIAASPFVGERHKKICVRLHLRAIHRSPKARAAPSGGGWPAGSTPQVRERSERLHDGKVTVDVPDTPWVNEAHTRARDAAVFAKVDRASREARSTRRGG